MSESIERFVGIDVSKGSLDIHADPPCAELPRHCGYDDAALKSLCDALGILEDEREVARRDVEVAVVVKPQVKRGQRPN